MSNLNRIGRPRIYQRTIDAIRPEQGWVTITDKQKTRTAPSAFRARYIGVEFQAVPNGDGSFSLQAMKSISTVSGREDE